MQNINIVKAEISVNVVKIGNRQLTVSVLKQIPDISNGILMEETTEILGWIKNTTSKDYRESIYYLASVEGKPVKMSNRALIRKPLDYETEVRRGYTDTIDSYNEWKTFYEATVLKLSKVGQLYIAV
jgi:hypothetical protein